MVTKAVNVAQPVTINASGPYSGKASYAFTLYPNNSVSTFALASGFVTGGQSVSCTIKLASPANALGIYVNLSSSSQYAIVPKTVYFAPGVQNLTIEIPTTAPATAQTFNLYASCSQFPFAATLTVDP